MDLLKTRAEEMLGMHPVVLVVSIYIWANGSEHICSHFMQVVNNGLNVNPIAILVKRVLCVLGTYP